MSAIRIEIGAIEVHTFTTVAACRIAGFDRQRLNDDIASGIYPCAPHGRAGVARTFDHDDLVGLHIYATLCQEFRFGKPYAAQLACEVIKSLKNPNLSEDLNRIDIPMNGLPGHSRCHRDDPTHFYASYGGSTVGSDFAAISFDLDGIRKRLQSRIDEEVQEHKRISNIVGGYD